MRMSEGVVIGKITDVKDPANQGRVQVRFPHMGDTATDWVSVASIFAGTNRGCFFMPEIDDEVLLAFQHGDGNHPFVIGFVWNPVQTPPAQDPRLRTIRSTNGHSISFVDSTPNNGNLGAIVIQDAHGNIITMTNGQINITAVGHLELSGSSINILGRPVIPNGRPI